MHKRGGFLFTWWCVVWRSGGKLVFENNCNRQKPVLYKQAFVYMYNCY